MSEPPLAQLPPLHLGDLGEERRGEVEARAVRVATWCTMLRHAATYRDMRAAGTGGSAGGGRRHAPAPGWPDPCRLAPTMDLLRRLGRLMPALVWLPRYRRADLPGDLTAGVTTAVMLIPQAMAYALLAGLPPVVGLYAAIAPPLVYALFGSSPKLAVGPVAMDSLLVAAAVGSVALAGTEVYVTTAAALALMVGAVQLAMGALRLGFVVNFLSRPVLSGFTSAAALVIAASQLGPLLGLRLGSSTALHTIVLEIAGAVTKIHVPTLVLAAVTMLVLVLLGRWRGKALLVVALGIAASALLDLPRSASRSSARSRPDCRAPRCRWCRGRRSAPWSPPP